MFCSQILMIKIKLTAKYWSDLCNFNSQAIFFFFFFFQFLSKKIILLFFFFFAEFE